MNRLTRKIKGCYCIDLITCLPMEYEQINKGNACVEKLGKLEDIEEELGIDFITLFKALKNGIYLKFGSEKITGVYYEHRAILPRHFDKDYKGYFIDLQLELSINFNFYFKDYGKTWALTKEELEEDYKGRD